MRILFTGGGTGGHIYPIIAIKRTFARFDSARQARLAKDSVFLYVGPDNFAKDVFKKESLGSKFILAGKLRRYFSLLNFIDFFKIPIGLIQSLWYVFWFMPDVIFSKGGYGSIPVVLAGWLYRIPIVIHESDSTPGLANRILARFTKKIIISFEETKKYFSIKKTILLGNPVREELIQGSREGVKKIFKINSEKPVILVMGGSQGAQKINEIIMNTLPRLLEKCEVIHICGQKNLKFMEAGKSRLLSGLDADKLKFYHPYPFLEEERLKHAYAISNLIISRAGAGSISEIAAINKASVLIPLASAASNHQTKNAWTLVKIGGAIILKERNLTINMFLGVILKLLDSPQKLKEMGEKAGSFYKPETNQKIVEEIVKLCQ